MVHFNDDLYLVPRGDSLVVGATTEPGVWSEGFDEVGESFIGTRLARMLPAVSRAPMERWAGLRPRPKDRLPWMGWIDPDKGWAICTGHYKCGISMAPLAAQCMNRLMQGEKAPIDLGAFNPWRRQGLSRHSNPQADGSKRTARSSRPPADGGACRTGPAFRAGGRSGWGPARIRRWPRRPRSHRSSHWTPGTAQPSRTDPA